MASYSLCTSPILAALEGRSRAREEEQLSRGSPGSCLLLVGSTSREGTRQRPQTERLWICEREWGLTAERRSGSRETEKNEALNERELRSKQEQMCTKNRRMRKRLMQRSLQVERCWGGGGDILLKGRWKSNDNTKGGKKFTVQIKKPSRSLLIQVALI